MRGKLCLLLNVHTVHMYVVCIHIVKRVGQIMQRSGHVSMYINESATLQGHQSTSRKVLCA